MPRPPRIEYAGAVYHVTSRGNGRKVIFHTKSDRERFLEQLQDNLTTYDVVLYAFVLMTNHYHLLLRTRQANLSRFAQRLNTSYGLYYRYKHDEPGHVFQGRYTAKLVDGDEYFLRLTRYLHLNPIKTKAIKSLPAAEQVRRLESYPWSSYPGYVNDINKLSWVDYDVLKSYGRSWREARKRYRAYTQAMVNHNDLELMETLKCSSYAIGTAEFIDDVENKLKSKRQGSSRDRDTAWPSDTHDPAVIDRVVENEYGLTTGSLKQHGHIAGEAKQMALELSVRLTGRSQREIGEHYGGISSSAVTMARRKFRNGDPRLLKRLDKLIRKCHEH